MIVFSCPDCGKELKVSDDLIGKRRRCPGCQNKVMVPADGKKTMAMAGKGDDARTLPPPARPKADAQTLSGGQRDPGDAGDTISPDGAALPSDPTVELTKFLEPAQGAGEIGRLGKYRVVRILGAGGMGVVFEAEDTVLERSVALKALLPGVLGSDSARARFLREAKSSAALQHDNVVTVYEVNEVNGVPFIAMQLLNGEGLDARLTREPTLPPEEVMRVGRETAEGLAAAHARGMVHRDIKPANLFLEGAKGRVKILDFGLARPAGESQLTQFGAIVGTPGYISPEQASGKAVDARGDLFSLGCVLYRLATGELPFKGEDMLAMLTALVTTRPAAPHKINDAVPVGLSDLILRLLNQKPEARPASARAVVEELDAIASNATPAPTPTLKMLVDDEAKPKKKKSSSAAMLMTTEPIKAVLKKASSEAIAVRVVARREDDRPRKPKRKRKSGAGVVFAVLGTILLLTTTGLAVYFATRNAKGGGSKSAAADDDKPSKPGDPAKPNNVDPGRPNDPAKPDNTRPDRGPLKFVGEHFAAFSPDNLWLVSAAPGGDRVVLWDRVKQGAEYIISNLPGTVFLAPQFSADGKRLIVGAGANAVVYDVEKKQTVPQYTFAVEDLPKTRGAFFREIVPEKLVAVGFAESGTPLAVIAGHHSGKRVFCMVDVEQKIHPAGGKWFFQDTKVPTTTFPGRGPFFGGPKGGKDRGGERERDKMQPPVHEDFALKGVMTTPQGNVIVIDADATRIWSIVPAGWAHKVLPARKVAPRCFAVSPDSRYLLTSFGGNEVHTWDVRTGTPLKSNMIPEVADVEAVGFSADGKLAWAAGRDGAAHVFDPETGEERYVLPGTTAVFCAAVAPDVRSAVTTAGGGTNLTWHTLPQK